MPLNWGLLTYIMKVNYGLTIAKCLLDKPPSKQDIYVILHRLFEDHKCNLTFFKVQCFEYKKNQDLHYHACIQAQTFIKYNEVVYKGWSVKLKWLKTPYDIINWCGYVQKDKLDKVDIKYTIKKVQKFKKDKARLSYMPHAGDITKYLNMEHTDSEDLDSS